MTPRMFSGLLLIQLVLINSAGKTNLSNSDFMNAKPLNWPWKSMIISALKWYCCNGNRAKIRRRTGIRMLNEPVSFPRPKISYEVMRKQAGSKDYLRYFHLYDSFFSIALSRRSLLSCVFVTLLSKL